MYIKCLLCDCALNTNPMKLVKTEAWSEARLAGSKRAWKCGGQMSWRRTKDKLKIFLRSYRYRTYEYELAEKPKKRKRDQTRACARLILVTWHIVSSKYRSRHNRWRNRAFPIIGVINVESSGGRVSGYILIRWGWRWESGGERGKQTTRLQLVRQRAALKHAASAFPPGTS